MKVVHLSRIVYPFHGFGGLEKFPYYICKNLLNLGVEAEIVTSALDNKRGTEIYDGIKYTFLPPETHNKRLIGPWQLWFIYKSAKYLQKYDFDILHSYLPPFIYLKSKKRKPTIVQPFGLEWFTLPTFKNKTGLKKLYIDLILRKPWKYSLLHADAVGAEGDFQIEPLINLGIKRDRIINLPIGVDIPYIKKNIQQNFISREELGLKNDDFVIISVNKYIPDKGVNYLIAAYKIIKQTIPQSKLIIIGSCNRPEEIRWYDFLVTQSKRLDIFNSVIFIKNAPENKLFGYYNIADIYLSPTLYEDIIMSIQEAMVCGLPVVSTGQKFLVQDGVNGYVVPPKEPEMMAEAVIKIFRENRIRNMGQASAQLIQEYDWQNVAKNAVEVYKTVMEKRLSI